jgi:hypothetical protein
MPTMSRRSLADLAGAHPALARADMTSLGFDGILDEATRAVT